MLRHGILTHYIIKYTRIKVLDQAVAGQMEDKQRLNVTNSSAGQDDRKNITLTNLAAVSQYEVLVRACNVEGCHAGSATQQFSVQAESGWLPKFRKRKLGQRTSWLQKDVNEAHSQSTCVENVVLPLKLSCTFLIELSTCSLIS